MNSDHLKYEDALMGILHCEGEIMKFLDVIFGFLFRRTDFYKIQHNSSEKLGFPPGIPKKLVLAAFEKYHQLALKNEELYQKKMKGKDNFQDLHETEVKAQVNPEMKQKAKDLNIQEDIQKIKTSDLSQSIKEQSQENFQNLSECYNGAMRENYSWSQNLKEVDVKINVPDTIKSGKQVKVDIKPNSLKVCVYKNNNWETIVDGTLTFKINVEKSMWTLFKSEHIFINLEKVQETWWEALLEGEPKIDIQKIDNSQPFEELDQEAQAKIDELMYNQQQKLLGKPTSNQQKVHDILKEAWDKEGSPFKGTPYDPSLVNVENSNNFSFK
ncbi:nudC domain-containing protein 3 [Centruroides vittatus]|uniref:nudC domain-containing protein 3 n=1 Tax=Centruroides vittatus TaxID=120091 RepID=UPI00350F69B9